MTEIKVKLLKKNEIKNGEVKVFEGYGKRIALAKLDDNLYAFDDVCTHDYGTLTDGVISGPEIECPRHGARFDVRTGEALCLPAVTPIEIYPVIIEGDEIAIELKIED